MDTHILVVDDFAGLRQLCERILKKAGYQVTSHESGAEALDFLESAARVDLLVTDVVMPNVTGIALAHKYKKRFPEGKVLLLSGYGQIVEQESDFPILSKPFSAEILVERVRNILDED